MHFQNVDLNTKRKIVNLKFHNYAFAEFNNFNEIFSIYN